MKKALLTSVVVVLGLIQSFAQEREGSLLYNPVAAQRYEAERSFEPRERGATIMLELPFFDDFSRYSLPTNDPDIPEEWQRWEDDNVYLNNHFPVEPPTIGVATFDGLKSNGYPYNFNSPFAQGPADTLTSLPLDLNGLSEANNVYLTFFYQPEGLGNDPDPSDEFILEFYRPSSDSWIEKWRVSGTPLTDFQQVFIPLADTSGVNFFQDGFRFRFRAEGTLSGNMDHWHLDYVYLDTDIDPITLDFIELALMDPEQTLLHDYTAMPWTHFMTDPDAFMLQGNTSIMERVLGSTPINFESGFRVEYEDQVWDMPNSFVNTSGIGIIETMIESEDWVYPTDVNDTCAVFTVKFYHEIADATQQNDTTSFEQVFTNYYAYDDGSAEKAYALNEPGGQVAMRYRAEKPDTLLGLFIHFTPFEDNNENETFLLRAWQDAGGQPGDEIVENFGFHSPNYYEDGYNIFAYYEYDAPIFVDGTFYCGTVQDSDATLNFGNDKNTNSNPLNLFYKLGLGSDWSQSSITGSVMIRPVFQSGKTEVWNSIGELEDFEFLVYPNPANDQVSIYPADLSNSYSLEVYSLAGQLVYSQGELFDQTRLDVQSWADGIYTVRITAESGAVSFEKFVKQ